MFVRDPGQLQSPVACEQFETSSGRHPMAFRDDELFELLGAAKSDHADDSVGGASAASGPPPLRVRPAVRTDHELSGITESSGEADEVGEGSGSIGAVTSSSRRLRIRPAGLRASTASDRRSASGRLAPPSPPGHRAPHPRAISGRPRQADSDGVAANDPDRSESRRHLNSSHGFPTVGEAADLDEIFGPEPIIIVDEMPPSNILDASQGLSRPVRFRVDTLLVACFLGLVMLGVSFMLGRGSNEEGERLAAANEPSALPALSISGPRRGLVSDTAVRPPSPQPRREVARESTPRRTPEGSAGGAADKSLDDPSEAPTLSIMAMRANRSRAEEVRSFLEGHGLRVYLEHVNARTTNVRVGGYAARNSARAKADLKKVQALRFEKTVMKDAYWVSWKELG